MKTIYSVKQYGKTEYGTLAYPEYIKLLADDLWGYMYTYMNGSYVMQGEY